MLYESLTDESDEKNAELKKIHEYFLGLSRPNIFHPSDKANLIKVADASFESICTMMEEKYNVKDAGKLSLYKFVSRIQYIEDKIEQERMKG